MPSRHGRTRGNRARESKEASRRRVRIAVARFVGLDADHEAEAVRALATLLAATDPEPQQETSHNQDDR